VASGNTRHAPQIAQHNAFVGASQATVMEALKCPLNKSVTVLGAATANVPARKDLSWSMVCICESFMSITMG